MEEVDTLIFHAIRALGADVPQDINSLKQISTELFIEGCARCINAIRGNEEMPLKLPGGMSARFRVGTTLAASMKELGYPSDIGYNTFLYSNEADSRSLLMWLVEKLPKESSDSNQSETMDKRAMFHRVFVAEIGRRIAPGGRSYWTPAFCKKNGIAVRGDRWFLEGARGMVPIEVSGLVSAEGALAKPSNKPSEELQKYFENCLTIIATQPPLLKNLNTSVLQNNTAKFATDQAWANEWNTLGVASGLSKADYLSKKQQKISMKVKDQLRSSVLRSTARGAANDRGLRELLNAFSGLTYNQSSKFSHQEKLVFAKEPASAVEKPRVATEEELQAQRNAELKTLQDELDILTTALDTLEAAVKKYTASLPLLEKKLEAQGKENADQEELYKIRKEVLDLLPNADENIAQLQEVVDTSAKRIGALATKWDAMRATLITEFRKLRDAQSDKRNVTREHIEQLKVIRVEIAEAVEISKAKDVQHKQLSDELENMKAAPLRSSYTRRIMEIVTSINRQNSDIQNVLRDTYIIQKEVNQVREKLDRVFHLTDDLIFTNAKTDDAAKQSYKNLADLHKYCNYLV